MDPLIYLFFVFLGYMIWSAYENRPIVVEGKVLEKNISPQPNRNSSVLIEAAGGEKITLKFQTAETDIPPLFKSGENFQNRARELDSAIQVNDIIKIKTRDKETQSKEVYRLISVKKSS